MSPKIDLRELAFQMRSEELRQYGQTILANDPSRVAASEVLDLMAYLVACDFVGAEAKLATIKFRFDEKKEQVYLDEATSLAQAHIDFAFGRFRDLEESVNQFMTHHEHIPNLEDGEFLDVLRLRAQKCLIMDEYEALSEIYLEATKYKSESSSANHLFLINSIAAMSLLADGEFFKALEIASRNIEIARQNQYRGLMSPVDSMYVVASCLYANARSSESLKMFYEIVKTAENYNLWPWYFIADGFISRDYAQKGSMTEALALVRQERSRLSEFNFRHELSFIPDINELYVRFLINDFDRIETLLGRVPKITLVRQIEGFVHEIHGKDMYKFIQELPEKTPREKIYKYLALADYYKDKESIAIEFMVQALDVVENSGFIEMLLRQLDMVEIVMKAVAKKPSVFLEDLASRLLERVNSKHLRNREGMPLPLTSRELEVVKHLSTGVPISAISGKLHVSMNTMKTHLRNIYRKLDVDGRENAVVKAKELFLI